LSKQCNQCQKVDKKIDFNSADSLRAMSRLCRKSFA
jgi:hypothetical protein